MDKYKNIYPTLVKDLDQIVVDYISQLPYSGVSSQDDLDTFRQVPYEVLEDPLSTERSPEQLKYLEGKNKVESSLLLNLMNLVIPSGLRYTSQHLLTNDELGKSYRVKFLNGDTYISPFLAAGSTYNDLANALRSTHLPVGFNCIGITNNLEFRFIMNGRVYSSSDIDRGLEDPLPLDNTQTISAVLRMPSTTTE